MSNVGKNKPERLDQIPDNGDFYLEGVCYAYIDDEEGDTDELQIKFAISTNEYPYYKAEHATQPNGLSEAIPLIEALQETLNKYVKEVA
tara:strand:+ start:302 stop:568 length:267 start_codon:yes stop_codon:yes gene_type:complete